MKNTKNATIALLCVSAAIMATVLILMHVSTRPALADTPIAGGDYIMVTGAVMKSTDLVYVVDLANQKLNAYRLEVQNKHLKLVDQVNLQKAFAKPKPR